MPERKETCRYIFTVEGETERWYFEWLQDTINADLESKYNVSIKAVVQQDPMKYAKGINLLSTPSVTHVCDYESNDEVHVEKFHSILGRLKDAKKERKGLEYDLGYSNFTFELWIVLHKRDFSGPLTDRTQYLSAINRSFAEHFENLAHYKQKDSFKRCLAKLSLANVKAAIFRARSIMENNEHNGLHEQQFKGFKYYRENPSLSVWEYISDILNECGLL